MRLFDYMRAQGYTNRQTQQLFAAGQVYIDGVPTSDGGRDVELHEVDVRPNARRLVVGRDPFIVYHDEDLAVVHKPAGLLSVPAAGRADPSILSFIRRVLGRSLPVHRLDEQTSGLMLVALTQRAQRQFKDDLAAREIERRYMALVRHNFPPTPQTFDSVFVRNRGDGKRGSLPQGDPKPVLGKRATTHVRLLETLLRDASLIEARLDTGRTHQVRIHLAEAGFPILGDGLYGSPSIARASSRLALHAWFLRFVHPCRGVELDFMVPLPDDLEKLRRRLLEPRGGHDTRRPQGRRPVSQPKRAQ